ncbi:MAG: phage tail length tape measure family protein, partial [Acetobacteraceae bacterium]|nr:phage tail length tape measure family protein [Acetobacteraceae bacterium]
MSGTRTAAIRIATDDVGRARQNLEALGTVGDAALRKVADAGRRAANAFAGVQANLAGDGLKSRTADIAAYGAELDRLRAKFDPVFAASKRYEAVLAEIGRAEQVGAINATIAAQARARLNADYSNTVAPLQRATQVTAAAVVPIAALAKTTDQAAWHMRALAQQMPDVVQGILGGQSAFQILVQQGGQVVQVTGGMGAALRTLVAYMGGPYVLAAAAAGAGLAALAARSADLANEQRQLDVALRGVGRAAEVSAASLTTYVRALERQGVARDEARKIAADLARTQGLSGQNVGRAATLAPDLAAALGVDAAAAARQLAEAFAGGYDAIRKLDDALNVLTVDQRAAVRTMLEHGDKARAADLVFEALAGRLSGLNRDALSPMGAALRDLSKGWNGFIDSVANSSAMIALVKTLGLAVQGMAAVVGSSTPAQRTDTEIARLEAQLADRDSYGAPAVSGGAAAILRQQLANLRAQRMLLGGEATGGAAAATAPATSTASATGDSAVELQRQQKLVDDLTLSYQQQQRVLAASVPDRVRVRAEIQAENEARDKGISGAAAEELKRRRVAEALASETDARGQETAAITREGQAALALVAASDQGRAAMLRARAAAEAHEQAATRTGVAEGALTQAILNRNAAQEAAKGAEAIVALREQIAATEQLAAAETQGPRAAFYAGIAQKVRDATRELRAHRDAATDPAIKAALDGEIERVGKLIEEQERQNQTLALKKELTTDKQAIELLQREMELLGETASTRERELAALRAIQQIERGGGDRASLTPDQVAYVEGKKRLADVTSELRQQQTLYTELGNIGVRAMDRIGDAAVNALLAGEGRAINFGNVLRGVAASVAADFLKLAAINPLSNALFGGERPSLFGGAGGSGGGLLSGLGGALNLGQLFGGQSIGQALGLTGSGGLLSTSIISPFGGTAVGPLGEIIGVSSGASLGGLLGGAGAGFGAGMLLNNLLGGHQTGGTIGSGVGAVGGAIIGSLIPGIGTLIGGLIGGAAGGGLGGLFGPGESVRGWGLRLQSSGWDSGNVMADGLLPIDRRYYNESGAATFAQADQPVASLNAYLAQQSLQVGGVSIVGGSKNGPDYSWADAGSLSEAFTRLRFASKDSAELTTALSGKVFDDPAKLQAFVDGFRQVQAAINALTADAVPAFTAQLQAVNDNFDSAVAKAREYGLAEDKLAAARSKAIADLEAQRAETLRQSGVSLDIRRLAAGGDTQTAELARHAEQARLELDAFARSLDALAVSAADKAQRLVELEEVQAAERLAIIQRYGEQAAEALRQAGATIRSYLDTLAAGTAAGASPTDRLAAAQTAFDRDRLLATGGDRDALGRITQTADALLAAGRDVYASSAGFQDIKTAITAGLTNLPVVQSYDALILATLQATQDLIDSGALGVAINPAGNVVTIANASFGTTDARLAAILAVDQAVHATLAAMHASMFEIGAVTNATLGGINAAQFDVGAVTNTTLHGIHATLVQQAGALMALGTYLAAANDYAAAANTIVASATTATSAGLAVIATVAADSATTIVAALGAGNTIAVAASTANLAGHGATLAAINLGNTIAATSGAAVVAAIGAGNTIAVTAANASTVSLAVMNRILVDGNAAIVTSLALSNTILAGILAKPIGIAANDNGLLGPTLNLVQLGQAINGNTAPLPGAMAVANNWLATLANHGAAIVAGSNAGNQIAVDAANAATLGIAALNRITADSNAALVTSLAAGNTITATVGGANVAALNATNTINASYYQQAVSQRAQLLAEIAALRAQVAALTQIVQQGAVLVAGEARTAGLNTVDAVLQVKSAVKQA